MNVVQIPITAYRVLTGEVGPSLDDADIVEAFRRTNLIWSQANVAFDCAAIYEHEVEYRTGELQTRLYQSMADLKPAGYSMLNAYFADWPRSTNGLNGARCRNAVMVNDASVLMREEATGISVLSIEETGVSAVGRVLAHELGHVLLGDGHPTGQGLLMRQGYNGRWLTVEEIKQAHETALRMVKP